MGVHFSFNTQLSEAFSEFVNIFKDKNVGDPEWRLFLHQVLISKARPDRISIISL